MAATGLTYSVLLALYITVVLSQKTGSDVTVITKKGTIIGTTLTQNTLTNVLYDLFIGIPYAQVPARFQRSVPASAWTSTIQTKTDGKPCPQPGLSTSDENCLFLNVYTPKGASGTAATTKYPVMVYIHGGGFVISSSSSLEFGPDFLVKNSVILVTMNYRLGALGFLTLGSPVAPGNLGLWDTSLALQWVQDEIAAFGGDPTQVTLFGESVGSVMALMHYLSPRSIGHFKYLIAQSGTPLADWSRTTAAEGARRGRKLASALGCDITLNETKILACLQNTSVKDIVDKQVNPALNSPAFNLSFVPVLDTMATSDLPFFNDSMDNLMAAALKRGKPLLTGFTIDEGVVMFGVQNMIGFDTWKYAESNLITFLPQNIMDTISDSQKTTFANQIKNKYFNDTVDYNKIQSVIDLYTDTMFAYPNVKMTRYFSALSYGYLFAFAGSWTPPSRVYTLFKMWSVPHFYDTYYMFYKTGSAQDMNTCTANKDLDMMSKIVGYWTSFAKSGIPDNTWKTVANGGYRRLDTTDVTMNVTFFESQYYNFWASFEQKSSASLESFSLATLVLTLCFLIINLSN